MFLVDAQPNQFQWQGHNVEVYEAWREHAGSVNYLVFKLKIDGELTGEDRLYRESRLHIDFRRDGKLGNRGIDHYAVASPHTLGKRLLAKPRNEYVHFLRMDSPENSDTDLRLGAYGRNETQGDSRMSDIVIKFIPSHGTKESHE
jgi:hypothetical protein